MEFFLYTSLFHCFVCIRANVFQLSSDVGDDVVHAKICITNFLNIRAPFPYIVHHSAAYKMIKN